MTFDALIIKKEWLDQIIPPITEASVPVISQNKLKTLEIRGCNTKKRGLILLIESGSGLIKGCCELTDSKTLSEEDYNFYQYAHRVSLPYDKLPYKTPYGWHLFGNHKFPNPIPYQHKRGAVIWVKIPENKELMEELENSWIYQQLQEEENEEKVGTIIGYT